MKDIPARRGRAFIASLIAEGEHDRQDFKFAISDARKIARSVSAFANALGGRLLIGVKDNGAVAGVRNEEDIYVVEQAARRYCRPAVEVGFTAYRVDESKIVIVAEIPKAEQRPVRCQDEDGRWMAYYRVADENILAHPLMVRSWQAELTNLALDEVSVRLMEAVDAEPEGLDPDRVALQLHISRRHAESLVSSLAVAGIIDFVYLHGHFVIIRKSISPT